MPILVYSHGVVTRGSTDPVLLAEADGRAWLTKLQPPPMLDHLAELVVAALAVRMGVQTPDFRIATVEPGLAHALAAGEPREARLGGAISHLGHRVFASLWLSGAADVTEPPAGDPEVLTRVLALDLLVANPDRRYDHPNLLRHGGRLFAMDHAQALPWCREQGVEEGLAERHVATALGLAPARIVLSESEINAAVDIAPREWWPSEAAREATICALAERARQLARGALR